MLKITLQTQLNTYNMAVQNNSIEDYETVYLVAVLCKNLKQILCEQTNHIRSVHIVINFRIYKSYIEN